MARKFLLMTVFASLLSAWAMPAAVAEPAQLRIDVLRDANGDTWTSTGAFVDAGSLADAGAFTAGSSSTFHTNRLYTGSDGSFTVRADVRLIPTSDPSVLDVEGRWAVLSGTGAYARLHGAGTVDERFDTSTFVISGTWRGLVTFGGRTDR
jgi:opacity protein-like surface antigen